VFAALLCTILFSVSIICGHRSAKLIGGTEANFWRLVVATFFLGIWAYGFGKGLSGSAFPIFFISGMVGIGIGDGALFQALPRLGSRLSMLLIQCLTAPFGALIERWWLGTLLTRSQIASGLIILVGVGIALTPGKHLNLTRRNLVAGVLFGVLSALGGAIGAVLSRKAYAVAYASGEPIDGGNAAFQRAVGGLLIGALGVLIVKRRMIRTGGWTPAEQAVQVSRKKWREVWLWVLLNGFCGQTLGVSCMQWALATTPTGIVLAIIAVTPVVIIPFTFAWEGERPTVYSVFGGALAVGGVVALIVLK